MPRKYIENTTSSPTWVSGVMIPPGEGREVMVPDEGPALTDLVDDVVDLDGALRELLAGNVSVVVAGLDGLSEATLTRLQELENAAEKPRKGVLAALADKLIAIADDKLKGEDLGDGDSGPDAAGGETGAAGPDAVGGEAAADAGTGAQ
ncbi:MAG: hypothetical protein QE265_12375 [Rhodoferax sp.]|nr:hypothetical protein [Rhodoferax sp.]